MTDADPSSRTLPPTLPDLPDLAEFRRVLKNAGFDEARLVIEHTGTIIAPLEEARRLDEPVRELPLLVGEGPQRELKLKASIGRGGMGQVRRAEQIPLGREVAVKSAVPGGKSRHEAAETLLREARVTGALEHPNIVPVHTLGRTDDGEVLLVMKRIEGTGWDQLLSARESPLSDLERHLEIFMEVCQAVSFAHSRGVLHRDLKPANVMVGPFGEVYVLDWGLAVCLGEHDIPMAQRADALTSLAGTPAYMAPEMTVPGGVLDERTDTYLLGGVLHAVLTGRGPHGGDTVSETLHAAYLSTPPVFAAHVPAELAALCVRALARDPAARFPSAEALRAAVADFLRHANARALCAEASVRLASLLRLVREGRDDDPEAYRSFSASRFGFEAALRAWPGSPEARQGVGAAIRAMAEYEIRRKHLDAALVLAGELDERSPDLEQQLEALRRTLAHEADAQAQLEAVARDADVRPGQRRRATIILAVGVVWAAFSVVVGALGRAGIYRPTNLHVAVAAFALLVLLLVLRRFTTSADDRRAGRHFAALARLAILTSLASWLVMWATDAPFTTGLAVMELFVATTLWIAGSSFDRRLLPPAALIFAGVPVVALVPHLALELNGAFIAGGIGFVAWAIRR